MDDELVVDISCLRHTYPGGVLVDICGLEFQVRRGARVVILGPNGSGKTTLLKHILGILHPNHGHVRVFGRDPVRDYPAIRPRIGAVMQNVDEQLIGPTVFDDIAFAPLNFGLSREETIHRVEEILRALRIEHLRDRLPHFLSGGERKKVALAGALVTGPDLLVMDEPLVGIDVASRREIAHFLNALHRETGMTMISTMHDLSSAGALADTGYVMGQGGRLELQGALIDLFYDYDLNAYNLAPPQVVQVATHLRRHGIEIERTLDPVALSRQLLHILRKG